MWGREVAEVYDETYASKFEPAALGRTVDVLAELARDGSVLEFAVGTGRVALPLSARGVPVHGIELSPYMVEQLRRKPGADAVSATIGDMTTTKVAGPFTLVYLVANTIMNVTTQDEQVAVFENAASPPGTGRVLRHRARRSATATAAAGEMGRVFTLEPDHIGLETFDDVVGQISWSHHWMSVDGRLVRHSAPYRYIWPAELELMAKVAGFRLRDRWADWNRSPFTSESVSQVAVFEKLP